MENNKLTFTIKDNQIKVEYDHPMNIQEYLQVISTGVLVSLNAVVQAIPETNPEARAQAKEDLYDMYNAAASNTLHYFAPEIDMRPHLTAQAILEAENAIIEREAKQKARKEKQSGKLTKDDLKVIK